MIQFHLNCHPVTGQPLKDGDFVWQAEYWVYPEDYTAEAQDRGEYEPTDADELNEYFSNMPAAVKFAKKIAKQANSLEAAPGRPQWGCRIRRLWWNAATKLWEKETEDWNDEYA